MASRGPPSAQLAAAREHSSRKITLLALLSLLATFEAASGEQSQESWLGQQEQPGRNSQEAHELQQQQLQHAHKHHHSSTSHLCSILPEELSRQLKLCKLIRHSLSANEVVSGGASRGLAECRAQFSRERWNCTHQHGEQNLLVGQLTQSLGNREGAFVQAIAAAGIVHSIASACSAGTLSDCACDKTRVGSIRRQDENWKWGGCSNNIRHGMLFAKHFVELLDAVHQHQLFLSHQSHSSKLARHLEKRSLQGPSHVRSRGELRAGRPALPVGLANSIFHSGDQAASLEQQDFNFCKQSQNISQTTHKQLIKSLLSANSLEKHQEIRLAVNMHNNKIGRMAVAKNMELRCRCHGLSGSCSLKTCWLTLPSFQAIGNYLKNKYDSSVHIPSALNLNKLIPLMDRNEITAILSSRPVAEGGHSGVSEPVARRLLELAGMQADEAPAKATTKSLLPANKLAFELSQPASPPLNQKASSQIYAYYERHKQLQQQHQQQQNSTRSPGPEAASEDSAEVPSNTSLMSQQQYQSLLREMKLCNASSPSSHLEEPPGQLPSSKQQHKRHQQQPQQHGHQLKQASQVLSQLLHPHHKDELIHLHKSPSYCEPDHRHGFPGIQARLCSRDKNAPDSCDKLCCGRGFRTLTYRESYKCDCKFQYCCSINCSVCEQTMQVEVCN